MINAVDHLRRFFPTILFPSPTTSATRKTQSRPFNSALVTAAVVPSVVVGYGKRMNKKSKRMKVKKRKSDNAFRGGACWSERKEEGRRKWNAATGNPLRRRYTVLRGGRCSPFSLCCVSCYRVNSQSFWIPVLILTLAHFTWNVNNS